jgi:hypothetical protein
VSGAAPERPVVTPRGRAPEPDRRALEGWLRELGFKPGRAQAREGILSWDLRCDGRKRSGIPLTVILVPALGCLVWVPFAPPFRDEFRKSYRRLLRWNEEYPFVKFGVTEDERPVMTVEVPRAELDRDRLGEAVARCVAVCDLLADETARWLRDTPAPARSSVSAVGLIERYADRLGELAEPA